MVKLKRATLKQWSRILKVWIEVMTVSLIETLKTIHVVSIIATNFQDSFLIFLRFSSIFSTEDVNNPPTCILPTCQTRQNLFNTRYIEWQKYDIWRFCWRVEEQGSRRRSRHEYKPRTQIFRFFMTVGISHPSRSSSHLLQTYVPLHRPSCLPLHPQKQLVSEVIWLS